MLYPVIPGHGGWGGGGYLLIWAVQGSAAGQVMVLWSRCSQ